LGSKDRIEREKAQLRESRESLIYGAAEALFLEKGFNKTTIADIAKACELTKGAIYLYFKNKDELILMTMTRISNGFADLLKERCLPTLNGYEQVRACLDLYRYTFKYLRPYHVLDGQFNTLYDRSYPESSRLKEYFSANKRVFDAMKAAFLKGQEDETVKLPLTRGENCIERSVHMILNVTNSFVEKLSLRMDLMEQEQQLSLEEELEDFLTFLTASLKK
jgi:AcrR family transcriptional regulator